MTSECQTAKAVDLEIKISAEHVTEMVPSQIILKLWEIHHFGLSITQLVFIWNNIIASYTEQSEFFRPKKWRKHIFSKITWIIPTPWLGVTPLPPKKKHVKSAWFARCAHESCVPAPEGNRRPHQPRDPGQRGKQRGQRLRTWRQHEATGKI